MKDFFIFTYNDYTAYKVPTSITVVFVHQKEYSKHKSLIDEIESFYYKNVLSDKLIVILPKYCDNTISEWFNEKKEDTFRRVPGISKAYFKNHYYLYQFEEDCNMIPKGNSTISDDDPIFFKTLFRNGSTQIFKNRGGLVESSTDHHFVFPSGKHCAKFIRTGNVLINSSETFFLSIQLLPYFTKRTQIYCDTSSINVLPFAVLEIQRRFGNAISFPSINSFESYSIFESRKENFSRDALVLISSSTSGNIIDRFLEVGIASREQLLVLFFLGESEKYRQHETNIVCNLTKEDKVFESGVEIFKTHKLENGKCSLCDNHSRPIPITGDVFLTVQPKLDHITLKVTDAPKFLNSFVKNYRGINIENVIFKNYYRESNGTKGEYEIFIDTNKLFQAFPSGSFPSFGEKITRKINTHIPANVKYLLHLPDDGSQRLAEHIRDQSNCDVAPTLVHIDDIDTIENENGCVVIVASSIVTGRHLLHVSRVLRKYTKLSLVYFVGVFRPISKHYGQVLKSNLGRGKDGASTYPVIAVQEIFCSNKKNRTSWEEEKIFLEDLLGDIDEEEQSELVSFCKARHKLLIENKATIGFADDVFLKMFSGESLTLQRGFAFWDFEYKESEIFQSEVYFTMSTILANLRNREITSERTLQQSNYVRNLLSPENFHRFNDGVIQASILRAGEAEYFSYDLDRESSLQMKTLLESMADQYKSAHGEALLEFLLAIGLKKMRLLKSDLDEVFIACSKVDNKLIKEFSEYVKALLQEDKDSIEQLEVAKSPSLN